MRHVCACAVVLWNSHKRTHKHIHTNRRTGDFVEKTQTKTACIKITWRIINFWPNHKWIMNKTVPMKYIFFFISIYWKRNALLSIQTGDYSRLLLLLLLLFLGETRTTTTILRCHKLLYLWHQYNRVRVPFVLNHFFFLFLSFTFNTNVDTRKNFDRIKWNIVHTFVNVFFWFKQTIGNKWILIAEICFLIENTVYISA